MIRQLTAFHLRTVPCDKNATEPGQGKVIKASGQFCCIDILFHACYTSLHQSMRMLVFF